MRPHQRSRAGAIRPRARRPRRTATATAATSQKGRATAAASDGCASGISQERGHRIPSHSDGRLSPESGSTARAWRCLSSRCRGITVPEDEFAVTRAVHARIDTAATIGSRGRSRRRSPSILRWSSSTGPRVAIRARAGRRTRGTDRQAMGGCRLPARQEDRAIGVRGARRPWSGTWLL